MKFSATILTLTTAAGTLAMPSADQNPRANLPSVLQSLKRDASGSGFVHLGSDNILRAFDKRMEVVDAVSLSSRSAVAVDQRSPGDTILAEIQTARSRSLEKMSTRRSADVIQKRQTQSCVSEFCPDDSYCQGLQIYGYNCTSCLYVTDKIGNCQSF